MKTEMSRVEVCLAVWELQRTGHKESQIVAAMGEWIARAFFTPKRADSVVAAKDEKVVLKYLHPTVWNWLMATGNMPAKFQMLMLRTLAKMDKTLPTISVLEFEMTRNVVHAILELVKRGHDWNDVYETLEENYANIRKA